MADTKAVRRYQAGVERALGLFDSTNEWADYIAFLSRLFKSLQDPPLGTDIPLKGTIARHLAQCLKPSLPSGVHQKALDIYGLIFTIIGPQILSKDLTLYLPGLSHTLTFASLATRPQILSLYDDYILALPADILRPALKALILSLLPSIEEESGEDFDKSLSTFNRLRDKFIIDNHEEIFWQNLFLASTTSANRRAGVLVYLNRYLPKLGPISSPPTDTRNGHEAVGVALSVTTPEPGLLVRCFATGLQDDQPLVQRGFLDLLVTHVPLDAPIFSDESHRNDVDVLVNAATTVVLRRDMSLNRRLWAWFTGSETKPILAFESDAKVESTQAISVTQKNSKQNADYFSQYGLRPLVRILRTALSSSTSEPASHARPFRIALSLMDRWEIGGPVVEAIFVSLIKNLQVYQSNAPSQDAFDEVFRSANVFFDGIEGRLIASQIIKLIEEDDLDLVLFLVTNFNLEDDEMMKRHIPLICLFVADKLQQLIRPNIKSSYEVEHLSSAVKLSQVLYDLLALLPLGVLDDTESATLSEWKSCVLKFYEQSSRSTKSIMLPLSKSVLTTTLLERVYTLFLQSVSDVSAHVALDSLILRCTEKCIILASSFATMHRLGFISQLLGHFDSKRSDNRTTFQTSVSASKVLACIWTNDTAHKVLTDRHLSDVVPSLIRILWDFLQPSSPQYHVEAVENIWRLHSLTEDLCLVESTILSLVSEHQMSNQEKQSSVLCFAALWSHSKSASKLFSGALTQLSQSLEIAEMLWPSLLSMIDGIDLSDPSNAIVVWMRSLSSLNPMFQLVLDSDPIVADQPKTSLRLDRVTKLVHLAKDNSSQWQMFMSQNDQANAVLDLCRSIVSENQVNEDLAVEALRLLQILVLGGFPNLSTNVFDLLVTQLTKTYHLVHFQDVLLDALQASFSNPDRITSVESLIPVLIESISSPATDAQIDKLVTVLCNVVPLLTTSVLMTHLIKITSCLCGRIRLYFSIISSLCGTSTADTVETIDISTITALHPERSISNLLAGMEYVLARAHQQALHSTVSTNSGVSSSHTDLLSSRSIANDHLTVVLCMQDTLKTCATLWLWRSVGRSAGTVVDMKSLNHISGKLRNRSRRVLENLIEAEPQECLETLMGMWVTRRVSNMQPGQILDLLQTLDGARPKFMMPATFNAIYNRTNPTALDRSQRSSLSVDVNAFELIAFLNEYTNALEDDLLDEIWADCSTFLKEILSNPMPHRQILLKLLEFTAVLCRKMENTNFGEESRTRRELADLCARLFTAIFTVKPGGLDTLVGKSSDSGPGSKKEVSHSSPLRSGNALQILQGALPDLSNVLAQSDRLIPVYTGIATHMTGPMLRSKVFPQNVTPELLALLQTISITSSAPKMWRKDIADAFNDTRFFQNPAELVASGWLPLIRQLALIDKGLMPDLLVKIPPPAAAGLMFGVGASAARTEADKKTQATLRRIVLLLLSMESDSFVPHLQQLLLKLEELLTATPESSPSSATRSDVYILLRTILLTYSQSQLASLWPLVDNEIGEMCTDMINTGNNNNTEKPGPFPPAARLQGAKLLDLLLLMKPDEFQLHEWLFVTDTVDAIYPPDNARPTALADQISALASDGQVDPPKTPAPMHLRRPWLCSDESRDPEQTGRLLAGFFSQLSIRAFEDNYSLQKIDLGACRKDLIADLFVDG